jgi:hypothetical protein
MQTLRDVHAWSAGWNVLDVLEGSLFPRISLAEVAVWGSFCYLSVTWR